MIHRNLEWFWRTSPGVWLTEIYWGQLVQPFEHVYDVHASSELIGFALDRLGRNLMILVAIGTIYRIVAFIGLFAGKKIRI